MLLLHPIRSRVAGPIRVIVIVRGRDSSSYSSGSLARSYLDAVCDEPIKTVMLCDSARPEGAHESLEAAAEAIANGDVDLVVTTDLTRIATWPDLVLKFLRHCSLHDVRVITFEDKLDTATPGSVDSLMDELT